MRADWITLTGSLCACPCAVVLGSTRNGREGECAVSGAGGGGFGRRPLYRNTRLTEKLLGPLVLNHLAEQLEMDRAELEIAVHEHRSNQICAMYNRFVFYLYTCLYIS